MTTAAYDALLVVVAKCHIDILGNQDIETALYMANTRSPKAWGLAIDPDGSWAWFVYPETLIKRDLPGWHMIIGQKHPKARFFRWNGTEIFEDQNLSVFTTRLYYEMEEAGQRREEEA